MLKKIFLLFIISVVAIQCNYPTSEDVISPVPVLIYPYDGAVISENINVLVEATDDDKIKSVTVYFDGKELGESISSPYLFPLNIDSLRDGINHTIQAVATDKSNNNGYSAIVTFVIAETNDIVDPTVSILNPQSGQTVEGNVRIAALADDERGIKEVAFFIDGDSIGTDITYPYQFDWDTEPFADSTNHTIYTKAFDTGGNSTISGVVTVTVYPRSGPTGDNTAPSGLMTYPLSGQVVFGTVKVTIEASDDNGVDRVELYVDGDSLTSDNEVPYQFDWNTTSYADDGSHSIYAKVFDAAGNNSTTAITTVTVSSGSSDDVTAPTGLMTYPQSGQAVFGTVKVTIEASDDRGVDRVELFVDGDSLTSDSEAPYQFDWNTASYADDGSHSIYAKVFDAAGNSSTTAITTVTVSSGSSNDLTAPTVLLLYPVAGYTVSGTVAMRADAQDNVAVTSVEFFVDGDREGNGVLSNGTWLYNWDSSTKTDSTQHTIYLKASDAAGNIGTSAITTVLVRTP